MRLAGCGTNTSIADLDADVLGRCMIDAPQPSSRPRLKNSTSAASRTQLGRKLWLRPPLTQYPEMKIVDCTVEKIEFNTWDKPLLQFYDLNSRRPCPCCRQGVNPLVSSTASSSPPCTRKVCTTEADPLRTLVDAYRIAASLQNWSRRSHSAGLEHRVSMQEGTDDTSTQQQLQLTVPKSWAAATLETETLKVFVSSGSDAAYLAEILQYQV